jgi:hypothetical protein
VAPERVYIKQRCFPAGKLAVIERESVLHQEVVVQEIQRLRPNDQVKNGQLFYELDERLLLQRILRGVIVSVDVSEVRERPLMLRQIIGPLLLEVRLQLRVYKDHDARRAVGQLPDYLGHVADAWDDKHFLVNELWTEAEFAIAPLLETLLEQRLHVLERHRSGGHFFLNQEWHVADHSDARVRITC